MLIKFLSFIASVLSNARYKAVLIPSIVVVLALTGLTTIALVHSNRAQPAASTADQNTPSEAKPTASPQISDAEQQNPKDNNGQQIAQDPSTDGTNGQTSADNGNASSTPKPPTNMPFDFTLSKTALTLGRDATAQLTATSADGSAVEWTIIPVNGDANPVDVIVEKNSDSAQSINFKFRTASNATPGQYVFNVTAKDTTRSINTSKTITVAVN